MAAIAIYFKWIFLLSTFVVNTVSYEVRIDCHPDPNASQEKCQKRGCQWNPSKQGIPWCIFNAINPETMAGYDGKIDPNQRYGILTRRNTPSLFLNDYNSLKMQYIPLTKSSFRIQIYPSSNNHPLSKREMQNFIDSDTDYIVKFQSSPFGFVVNRKSDSTILVDTVNLPGFTFSRQFVQLSTRVPTRNVYGIGEQWHKELRRDFNWKRYSLFNHDQHPIPETNLYSFHPFYMGLDLNNGAYGIYLHTTYPMDYFLQPDPDLITMRIIGGYLDIYLFTGPTCDDVIRQYTDVIGKPLLPPYWGLGYQLSRYGYKNLGDLQKVWDRNRAAHIPQDVQVLDIDYMDKWMDFTYAPNRFKNLPQFVRDKIHGTKRKLMLITDPAIASRPNTSYKPLELGLQMGVFINDSRTGKPIEGKVWPGNTYYPDFSNPKSTDYWTELMSDFHKSLSFDAIWLDMNDPSNFVDGSITGCPSSPINQPPYIPVPYTPLYWKSICNDAIQYLGTHYQWHNYYGHQEIIATHNALNAVFPHKRHMILSRSTAPGSGAYAAHWTGDNLANWDNLNQTIVALIEMSMFGIPFSGSDICGFGQNTSQELCLRWSQLGSFYPYSRNHNSDDCIDQDPAVWSQNTTQAIQKVLSLRYALLPYLYTLFYQAHIDGTPVVRPLFYDYQNDPQCWNLHEQFLWGSALMIVPILAPYKTIKTIYIPPGQWYNINDNYKPIGSKTAQTMIANIPKDSIGLILKGGTVIPWQIPAETTVDSRKRPFGITVALDFDKKANGQLFWDDGESSVSISSEKYCLIRFNSSQGILIISAEKSNCPEMPKLQFIHITGVDKKPNKVKIDSGTLDQSKIVYNSTTNALLLSNIDVTLYKSKSTEVKWLF